MVNTCRGVVRRSAFKSKQKNDNEVSILLRMSNLELYMTATERTEDTEGKYSVLSVFSVTKSYKKHTRFSIKDKNKRQIHES